MLQLCLDVLSLLREGEGAGMPAKEKFDLDTLGFDRAQEIAQRSFERANWALNEANQNESERSSEFREIALENNPEVSSEQLHVTPAWARSNSRQFR